MKSLYIKSIKWMLVQLACLTMVFAPVAMGKEAQELNAKNLQQVIKEFGLDKKITLGEFWERSKAYMPKYIARDLEVFVKNNKNMQMPEVTVDVSKSTDGTEIPTLTFSQNGKTSRAQIYGEKNKWAKFNGVNLSELDFQRPQDAFARIEASDIKLKNEAEKYRKSVSLKQQMSSVKSATNTYIKDFARFDGFPRVTPQMWKSLTKEQRVGYIIKMRLMWTSAKKVLATLPENSGAFLPNQKTDPSVMIENFYKIIFGQKAEAKGQSAGTAKLDDTKSCIVAGYVGEYKKVSTGKVCSITAAIDKSIGTFSSVKLANADCKKQNNNYSACEPFIYGSPGGKVACFDRTSAEAQIATHFGNASENNTCDSKSRLSSSADLINFEGKDYSDTFSRKEQIALIEADQQKEDYILTKSFLEGVLAHKDPQMLEMFEKGKWSLNLDNELVSIQSQFEKTISNAVSSCEKNITGKQEKNQRSACDQLHRRWLFTEREIAKLRGKACLPPARYIGSYEDGESSLSETGKVKTILNKNTVQSKKGLCECPAENLAANDKSQVKKVSFGKSCNTQGDADLGEVDPIVELEKAPEKPEEKPEEETLKTPEAKEEAKEEMKCGKPAGIAGYNYDQCACSDDKKLGEDKYGGYECKGFNWLPWAIGGTALAALLGVGGYFLFKKKSAQAAPPPAPACAAPKIGSPPNCSCAPCTLSQKVYDMNSCQCTNVVQPLLCADSTPATNGDLLKCPKCPNGSYKTTEPCKIESEKDKPKGGGASSTEI